MRCNVCSQIGIAAFVALTAAGVSVGARQDEKVVPVHQEPRHHMVFDSPATKILDIQIAPGDLTLFHTHSEPILYITMSTSQTRSQTQGREWSGAGLAPAGPSSSSALPTASVPVSPSNPAGRLMSTTTYSQQPLTHRVTNVGQTLFRLIGITNASAGDESTAPSADFAAKPELENRWFRGYRWPLAADASAQHRHANPVAIVVVTGRALVSGLAKTALDKPGAFAFLDGNSVHTVHSVGGAAEVIEVEVRRPR